MPNKRIKAGINLSPALRRSQYNLAAEIIRGGLESTNPQDFQQQRLGLPSEETTTAVTLDMLKLAMRSPAPTSAPTFILCGIDQGRSEHWLTVIAFHVPVVTLGLSLPQVSDKTIREVLFAGGVVKSELGDHLRQYGVKYGLIDNEPDREQAARLCDETCLNMADQKPGLSADFKDGTVEDGGIEYDCWKIRNEKYLRQVLLGFSLYHEDDGYPLYRLPSSWEKWINQPSDRSPLVHLTGPSYDPETGKWLRGKDNLDDIYYAFLFCEAAFSIYLEKYNFNRDDYATTQIKRDSYGLRY